MTSQSQGTLPEGIPAIQALKVINLGRAHTKYYLKPQFLVVIRSHQNRFEDQIAH